MKCCVRQLYTIIKTHKWSVLTTGSVVLSPFSVFRLGFSVIYVHFYCAMQYSAKCSLAIACCLSICLSVMLVDHDHIGWKSWKWTAQTISPTSSLFVAKRSSTYSQGNTEKVWGENVHSTPISITSGWIESNKSHVILAGGVAVCLL